MSEADAEASAEVFSILVWRQTSVKTSNIFLRDFTWATTPATHLCIIFFPFPHTLSFAILYPSTSIMCFKTIPVVSRPRSNIIRRRQRIPANLRPISTSSTTHLSFSMALWNCQSAVNKADFISRFFFTIHTQHLGLDWDLDSSRRLSNPSCPL